MKPHPIRRSDHSNRTGRIETGARKPGPDRFPTAGLGLVLVLSAAALLHQATGQALAYGVAQAPSMADQQITWCVSRVAIFGKAPVLDHPDGNKVLYRLDLGRCDVRMTDQCQGLWCHVTFKGGKGWMFRSFLRQGRG